MWLTSRAVHRPWTLPLLPLQRSANRRALRRLALNFLSAGPECFANTRLEVIWRNWRGRRVKGTKYINYSKSRSWYLSNWCFRMYVIGRMRGGSEECPEERVDIVGTTGNIYHVFVGKEPTCTCPDARKGNQCKHIIYVSLCRFYLSIIIVIISRASFADGPSGPSERPQSTRASPVPACVSDLGK